VEAVGANVRGLQPGEEVLGWFQGSFAEYARAAADRVVPKPARLSFEQAAAVTMAGRDRPARHPGRRTGAGRAPGADQRAAGGVGSFAVQIAAALGAEVTGVCRTRNVELVRSIGAARHRLHEGRCHRRAHAVRRDPEDVGNQPLRRLRRALTPTGTLVTNVGGSPGHLFGPILGLTVTELVEAGSSQRSSTGPTPG
jgi:NADPH:quinone reductase-like Zn-dependent oxidoreductase